MVKYLFFCIYCRLNLYYQKCIQNLEIFLDFLKRYKEIFSVYELELATNDTFREIHCSNKKNWHLISWRSFCICKYTAALLNEKRIQLCIVTMKKFPTFLMLSDAESDKMHSWIIWLPVIIFIVIRNSLASFCTF